MSTRPLHRLALAFGLLAILVIPSAPAGATLRGSNGPIYFSRPATSGGAETRQIFSIGARGGGLEQLTTGSANSFLASPSPNGRQVLFTSIRGPDGRRERQSIEVMNANGSRRRSLFSTTGGIIGAPAFSPSAGRIALVSDGLVTSTTEPQIFTIHRDGSGRAQLTSDGASFNPNYLPDGRIVFLRVGGPPGPRYAIFVMNPDGSRETEVFAPTSPPGQIAEISASPLGRTIAFTFRAAGPASDTDVYSVNLDGTGLRRLTSNPANDFVGSFSPNGRQIVFASQRRRAGLYVMDADGGGERRISNTGAADAFSAWGAAPG